MRKAWAAVFVVAWALSPIARAQPDADYDPANEGWNGTSALVELADDRRIAVEIPGRIDIGTLAPDDALLVLHPRQPLPIRPVTSFLQAGGRMALADDFGTGASLLAAFDIRRGSPSPEGALQLRSNPALLVARPRGHHRLTRGVTALVTNHPAMLYHSDLTPAFELTEGEAVVLAGAVGEGRLVALSDPSVLINNMLEFRGNRRFAENLLTYLDGSPGGRVLLVGPDVQVVGRFGEPGADRSFHDLRKALEAFAGLERPPLALRVLSFALLALATLWATGTLPRRSPYRGERMFAREAAEGGMAGRLAFFGSGRVSLFQPLMVYKVELEEALLQHLDLAGRTSLGAVLDAAQQRGMGEEDRAALRGLLVELDRLYDQRELNPPRITEARFHELVSTGERLLLGLERR
ncbi:MAG: DUF4350 domain-containing protein [Sandaracinaceae bacterium]